MQKTNEDASSRIAAAYRERYQRTTSWSGFDLKAVYGPADAPIPANQAALPGAFPFTRGAYPDMYRGRLWSRRELMGFSNPADSNERLKFLIREGESALNVAFDLGTNTNIDSDHPMSEGEVGVQGTPICSARDMEILLRGLPLDRVSINLSSTSVPIVFVFYLVAAERMGFQWKDLRGTVLNDTLGNNFCGYLREWVPCRFGLRISCDAIEFSLDNTPFWNPLSVDGYNIRENGVTAPQEIAYVNALACEYLGELVRRGRDINIVAPKIAAFTHSVEMDFFEEIAKLRAVRRLWAQTMVEKFGASQSSVACRYKFHTHTAGSSLVRRESINNVVRVAYQALAAVLGGTQSLHTCSFDEPIGLPTEDSVRLAIRTQQILAMETGVAAVADPLGGSWYVEALTDKVESAARDILAEIDKRGGMISAMESGWINEQVKDSAYRIQAEIESGDRPIVGVNSCLESDVDEEIGVHRVSEESVRVHLDNLHRLKTERDNALARRRLRALADAVSTPGADTMMPMIDAARADCTMGEIFGALRVGAGLSYDPLGQIEGVL